MSTQGNGPAEFLQTISTMIGLKQQQDQIQMQDRQNKVANITQFLAQVRQTKTPEEQQGLIAAHAAMGTAPAATLTQMAQSTAPNRDVQDAAAYAEGLNTLNPTDRTGLMRVGAFRNIAGQTEEGLDMERTMGGVFRQGMGSLSAVERTRLGQGAVTRQLTGMGRGQERLDSAVADLPSNQLARAAGIQTGTALSAPQVVQGQQFQESMQMDAMRFEEMRAQHGDTMALQWANLRQGERQFIVQSGLSEAEFAARLSGAGKTTSGVALPAALELYGAASRLLIEQKQTMSKAELQKHLNYINMLDGLISDGMGIPMDKRGKPLRTNDIEKPGAFTGWPGAGR